MGVQSESGRSPGGEHGNPLQYCCLENPMDRKVFWATVHGVTKSQTYWSNLARIHTSSISTLFSWFRRSTLLSATPGRHKIFQQKRRVASSCMFSCEQENLSQKPCSSLPSLHISLATVGHTPITKPFPEKVTDVDGYELAAVQGLLSEHMAT